MIQSQSFRFLSKILSTTLLSLNSYVKRIFLRKIPPNVSIQNSRVHWCFCPTLRCLVAFQRNQEAVEHSLRAKLKHSELGREADLVLRKESFLKKILVSMEYWRNFFPLDHDTCHHLHLFLSQKKVRYVSTTALLYYLFIVNKTLLSIDYRPLYNVCSTVVSTNGT